MAFFCVYSKELTGYEHLTFPVEKNG